MNHNCHCGCCCKCSFIDPLINFLHKIGFWTSITFSVTIKRDKKKEKKAKKK